MSEASYGTQHLLFAARDGAQFRSYELAESSRFDAERVLLDLEEIELRGLLARASPWHPG